MPLYEYECGACGHRFELIQRFSDAPAHTCTACGGGPVQKLLSAPAIQFKGTGWYVTDYAGKKNEDKPASPAKPDAAPAASAAASTAAKTAESNQ
ncbi:MAG: FmdB family zinc ribbon protein [Acidobacteriota bacterium]